MKQMICALLAVVLLLGLAGCKKDRENQLEDSQMTLEAETTEETTELCNFVFSVCESGTL